MSLLAFLGEMATGNPNDVLRCCVRDYLAAVPFRLFQHGQEITALDSSIILNEVFLHPTASKFPPAPSYACHVAKMVIAAYELEGKDIDGGLYEFCAELMAQPMQVGLEWCNKSYCIREPIQGNDTEPGTGISSGVDPTQISWVSLKERKQVISEGTTGLSTWDGALALSEWTVENQCFFAQKNVIELGCGPGLVGIAIALATTATRVVLTDLDRTVLDVAHENVQLNCTNRRSERTGTCYSVERLDWSDIDAEASRLLNESDVIVASDVVYDPELVPLLVNVLESGLAGRPKTTAVLSLTRRNPKTSEVFLSELESRGFSVRKSKPPVINLLPRQKDANIDLLFITKS